MYVNLIFDIVSNDYAIKEAGCEYQYEPLSGGVSKTESHPDEAFFFHDLSQPKLRMGISILETENIDDIDKYELQEIDSMFSVSTISYIDFASIDNSFVEYGRDIQKTLSRLIKANNSHATNRQMEQYCSIIEHLAGVNGIKKSPDIIEEIDALIAHVDNSSLNPDDKYQLLNYLNQGKTQSSRKAGIDFIKKYGAESYQGISSKKIWDEAYSMRSKAAHDGNDYPSALKASVWMKALVIDVLRNYYSKNPRSKEGADNE